MRHLTRNSVLLVALCTLALLTVFFLPACSKKNKERSVVRIGYIPFSNCLPFFVAVEKGYFKERGLEVQPVKCNDSSEALNALLAGEVDVLAGVTLSSYWAAEQEEPGRLKLFLWHYETPDDPFSYLLIQKDSEIKNPEELRGKTVGTYTGVSQLLYLRLFLKKLGMEPEKDVKVLQVGSNMQIQALAAKQFDALFTVEPYGTIAVLKGVAKVLVASPRTKYIQDPFWGGASAVTTTYLNNNRTTVSKVYEAMAEGVRFIRKDVATAKSYLPKYTPLEPEVASKSGLYKWVLPEEKFPTEGIQELADLMVSEGVLRNKIDAIAMLIRPTDLK
jgi:NitT/TauT family transport system substrate-binding protein